MGHNLLAQAPKGGVIYNPVPKLPIGTNETGNTFNEIVSNIVGILTLVAGIYFFFVLIIGALKWISSNGNKGKIEEAKQTLTTGLIGITVVVAAIFLVEVVGRILGFTNILNPANLIDTLGP